MDSQDQMAGERRVKAVLIEALERRGLVRPSKLTKDQYADMAKDLCQRLAYMTDLHLSALEEAVAAMPDAVGKGRMPIANAIYEEARKIQAPDPGASPLMRAVFAHATGQEALRGGWAPELLAFVTRFRSFPRGYVLTRIRDDAHDNLRRLSRIEERLAADQDVTRDDQDWRARRIAQIRKCQDIADLAQQAGGDL